MSAFSRLPIDPPIVAILRGLQPEQAVAVGHALFAAGIRIVEVPLNSPEPFKSIRLLSETLGSQCLIGAGTVIKPGDVSRVHAAGGQLIVAPNVDANVIGAAISLGMEIMPGIATATEAFAALDAGATHLKLFPASTYGQAHMKALLEVLPKHCRLYPVGGIKTTDMQAWHAAGAAGYGYGSELFKPAYSLSEISQRANTLVTSLRSLP